MRAYGCGAGSSSLRSSERPFFFFFLLPFSFYLVPMRPRIAIPVPHSFKPDYVQRSLPQYEQAIEQAGGEAVRIPLGLEPEAVARLIAQCDAGLLPGGPAGIDPQKDEQGRGPHTAHPHPQSDIVDGLVLPGAENIRKPG